MNKELKQIKRELELIYTAVDVICSYQVAIEPISLDDMQKLDIPFSELSKVWDRVLHTNSYFSSVSEFIYQMKENLGDIVYDKMDSIIKDEN